MVQWGVNWIAVPTALYYFLILFCGIFAVVSTVALIRGILRRRTKAYYILWGIVLFLTVAYLIAAFGFHAIVAVTMIGGGYTV